MQSQSSHNKELTSHLLKQLAEACDYIIIWNIGVRTEDDYLNTASGMEKMAATSMLLESIGEGVKKIDKLYPDFLESNEPNMPWRQIKGLRDHIAHGYFELDASIILDVALNEIPRLKETFISLQDRISLKQ